MSEKPTYEDLQQRIRDLEQAESEQKQTEKILKKLKESYERLTDYADEAIFKVKAEGGQVLYLNPAAERIFGYSKEEWFSDPELALKIIHPDYREKQLQIIKEINSSKKPIKNVELAWVAKHGRKVILEYTIIPIFGEEGCLTYFESIGHDITEHKQAEHALHESEQKWKNVLVNTPQIGIALDPKGKIAFANTIFLQLTGWEKQEVLGQDWFDMFIPEKVRDEVRKVFHATMRQKNILDFSTYENEIKTKSNKLLSVAWFNILTKDAEGNVVDVTCLGVDLTERKRAEEILRDERRRLSDILKGTNAGTWEWNVQTGETIFNERWAEIIGYTLEEISPVSIDTWKKFSHPDDVKISSELLEKHFQGELDYYECEVRMKHKNGSWVWILDRGRVTSWTEDGKPEWMYGTHQDVTVQKQAEEALRESESRYRTFFDKGPDGIVILNTETAKPIEFNDQVCRQLGYTREEFARLRLSDIDARETSKETQAHIQKVMDKGYDSFDTLQRTKQGEIRNVHVKAQIIETETGKSYHCIWRDVTEQVQAEKKIRFQAKLLASVGQAVVAAGVDGKITYWNKAAEQLYGWSSEEVIGEDLIKINVAPGDEKFVKEIMKDVSAGKKWSGEFRVLRKDGRRVPVLVTNTPIFDENGKWIGIISVSADLTQMKQMETQIRSVQKMESIGSLAGGIAHDFNNILFPIIGMSEMLLDDLPKGTSEYENAEEILKAGIRGGDLVKHILAFSRQSEHKMIPVRVQQILKEVLRLIRATIPSYIEIDNDIQSDCGLINADPTQIHQVTMNIITNAFHAVEDKGGKISIKLRETVLKDSDLVGTNLEPGKYVALSISDTGHGMPENILNKIFDPYFTTKEQGKGTGLGLSVVYGIIKEHKGDIRVCSKLGKGSTFNVYLPLMDKLIGDESIDVPEAYQAGNERILLVDDEVSVATLEKQMLERLGYKITSRFNSIDALEAFKADPYSFDMVITDMTMPYLTGAQLAEKVLAVRSDIPIIICTGFSERIDEEKAKKMGIKGFLMKPIVKAELAKMVRNILDEES